jgi:hypothetical protein
MYRLKKNIEAFRVVDGPFAGRRYKHGEVYTELPPRESHKFDPVNAEATAGEEQREDGTDAASAETPFAKFTRAKK